MFIPYVCVACLGLLVFALGLNVSLNRMRSSSQREDLKNPKSSLFRARLAHSNACQYCPMFCVLIALSDGNMGTAFGIVAVIARYLHAFGFLGFKKAPNPFIFCGALGTYISGLALSLYLLYEYLPRTL